MKKSTKSKKIGSEVRMQFPRPLSTKREWEKLTERLAAVLADLDEDEFLILSEKQRNVYVQFVAQGFFGMRVETTSQAFLGPGFDFSKQDKKVLRALGWREPTYIMDPDGDNPPDGSCNFFVDAGSTSFSVLADLTVRTLRDVYHTWRPGSLQYRAFGSSGYGIRFPSLGLKREENSSTRLR